MHIDGVPVAQMAALGSFSEYTLVDERSCVKIDADLPLDKACLTGCCVGTGWRSAVHLANLRPGDTAIVMCIGGIGINAVQGAAHAGSQNVTAVNPVEFKPDTALKLGATHGFASMEEATEVARNLTNGQGADAAVVTIGVTSGEHIAQAFAAIRKGGTVVVTGMVPMSEVGIPISAAELTLFQKRLQGSLFGGCSPSLDVPRQLEMYRADILKLDELVTRTYTLDEVAQGFSDLHAGLNIRGVVFFD